MNEKTKTKLRRLLPVFILAAAGLIGGYAYYYYVGCASGACVLSSNPYISTLYGGLLGGLTGSLLVKKPKPDTGSEKD